MAERAGSSLMNMLINFCTTIDVTFHKSPTTSSLSKAKICSSPSYSQTPSANDIPLMWDKLLSPVPIQNKRQNYCSVYFNLNVLIQQTRQKIPQHTAAGISQIKSACYETLNILWNINVAARRHSHPLLLQRIGDSKYAEVKNMWTEGRYIEAYAAQDDDKQYILRFTNSLAYLPTTYTFSS